MIMIIFFVIFRLLEINNNNNNSFFLSIDDKFQLITSYCIVYRRFVGLRVINRKNIFEILFIIVFVCPQYQFVVCPFYLSLSLSHSLIPMIIITLILTYYFVKLFKNFANEKLFLVVLFVDRFFLKLFLGVVIRYKHNETSIIIEVLKDTR